MKLLVMVAALGFSLSAQAAQTNYECNEGDKWFLTLKVYENWQGSVNAATGDLYKGTYEWTTSPDNAWRTNILKGSFKTQPYSKGGEKTLDLMLEFPATRVPTIF